MGKKKALSLKIRSSFDINRDFNSHSWIRTLSLIVYIDLNAEFNKCFLVFKGGGRPNPPPPWLRVCLSKVGHRLETSETNFTSIILFAIIVRWYRSFQSYMNRVTQKRVLMAIFIKSFFFLNFWMYFILRLICESVSSVKISFLWGR